MTVTQYIGNRYVPRFAEPLDWDKTKEYEALTIVYYAGNSYTSRQAVPKNIDISDETYWALTGNYNAQIEAYRKEVKAYDARITANTERIEEVDSELAQSISDTADSITKGYKAADTEINEVLSDHETLIKNNTSNLTAEVARAKKAEQVNASAIAAETKRAKYAEATIKNYAPTIFVGRAKCVDDNTSVQTVCESNTHIFIFCVGSNNTSATIYKFSKTDNTYNTKKTLSGLGHCNGACYNADKDVIYIAYSVNGSKTISVLNPTSMSITSTITVDVPYEVHSVAHDPITDKYYIASTNYPTVYVYEWVPDTNTVTSLFHFKAAIPTAYNYVSDSAQATQNLSVWNGEFFFACSEEGKNALINIDPDTNSVKNIIPIGTTKFPYSTVEMQGGYFNDDGCYISVSRGYVPINILSTYAVVYAVPVFGNSLAGTSYTFNSPYAIHLNPAGVNSHFNPYINNIMYDIDEAMYIAMQGRGLITIDSGNWTISNITSAAMGLNFSIPSNSTLTIATSCNISSLNFHNGGNVVITDGKYINNCRVMFNNVKVTGSFAGENSEFTFRGLLSNSSVTVDCRNSSFVGCNPGSKTYITVNNPITAKITDWS